MEGNKMAKKTFKKLFEIKVIEHNVIRVEADSEMDAYKWAVGTGEYGSARPVRDSNFKPIKKRVYKSAKVISEQDSADVIIARANRKAAHEAGQVLCTTCGKTRAKHHFYERYEEIYLGKEDEHEYSTVEGMKRWFEMNKEINKKFGHNNQTEFDKEDIERLKKFGISVA